VELKGGNHYVLLPPKGRAQRIYLTARKKSYGRTPPKMAVFWPSHSVCIHQ